jgi:hypothetical protein
MRIGIEADGSINANRTGPVDPFMTWYHHVCFLIHLPLLN